LAAKVKDVARSVVSAVGSVVHAAAGAVRGKGKEEPAT
jgi:hypothetical protein